MKLITFILFVSIASVSASSYSQQVKFSLDKERVTVQSVLDEIEATSEFIFLYSKRSVDVDREVNIKIKNQRIEKVLDQLFEGTNNYYEIRDRQIAILVKKKADKPAKVENPNVQQTGKKVTGKVIDANGEPLPGVTITVLGSTRGVITDMDGKFVITDIEPKDKLVFSFIGMKSQIVDVGNSTKLKVTLEDKAEQLEDVTVVAFGKQKKESVLASIESVDTEELKVPSSNLTTALAGRISGLISYQRSGEPGQDNAEFFVRGVTTFGYAKSPLILIDGIELTSNDLSKLNPDDIASFSIMKDATATALYGARGANGVILVTTKEGKEGKAKISIRAENSWSTPTDNISLSDPITYMKLNNEAVKTRDPLGVLPYSDSKIFHTEQGTNPMVYPAVDWHDLMFKNVTTNQRVNMNISGGGKVAKYYVAVNVKNDNGVLKKNQTSSFDNNISLKSYLLRSNVNVNLSNTTEMIVRFHGTYDDYKGPLDGGKAMYQKAMRANPVLFPAYYAPDEANTYTQHILFGNYYGAKHLNPYADMVKGYQDYSRTLVLAQLEFKQDLDFVTKGLSARAFGSTTRSSYFSNKRSYKPFYYDIGSYNLMLDVYTLNQLNPDGGTEYLEFEPGTKTINTKFYFEAAIDYNRSLGENHAISGLLVGQLSERKSANADNLQKSLPYRNLGLSGRFTYNYKSKYFAEFNFGYNGSERFAKNERFGFFPSAGVGYLVSNEEFWSNLGKVFPTFKLKATYGLVGNDAIGNAEDRFFYLSEVNMRDDGKGFTFGDRYDYSKKGISVSRYPNGDITWEVAKKLNVGVEMDLFGKATILFDVFSEKRSDILMDRASIPTTMGLQSKVRANVGEAKSHGIDGSIDFNHSFNKDCWLSARANFTYATSEFTVYEEPDYGYEWLSHIGKSLSQQWGYTAERLFIDEMDIANSPIQDFGEEVMPGDIKYKDLNNDGKITSLDRSPIGKPTSPEIVYGFGVSFGYKAFDISCFWQGLANESFWIDTKSVAPFVNTTGNTITNTQLLDVIANSHWSEDNRNIYAFWPRLSTQLVPNNQVRSTWFMHDGDFLRLKNLEIGYTLPKKLTNKYRIKNCRIYTSGTNLLVFSKFKLWDPEMAGNGFGYPIQRVFNLGLQLTF
ncbi:SusC/RagA family TonB-linked outer membrane protein [Puteibacter caeruleilacunae]|nr:SusC/RagA family TonB-linked outer membrane protein [Puteibacter caeruleilacunae]